MAHCGSHLPGIRLRARAAISGLVCCFVLFPPSVTSQIPPTHEDGQLKQQSSGLQASSKSTPAFCESLWIESLDRRIRTSELKTRLLTIPEFVNSGITFSPDAEHADLSLQLAVEADDGETGLEYFIASNPKTKVWDRVSFLWPAADYEAVIARRAVRLLFVHCLARPDNVPQLLQLPPEVVTQKFAAARTVRPVVHTSWMREEVLLAALKARPEFADWGIEVGGVNEPSDFDVVVSHVLSTLTWTFQLVDRQAEICWIKAT